MPGKSLGDVAEGRGASKSERVYDDLRAAIVDLRLKPGTRLDKHEICARLGVSRQPVSEAVGRLADEHLVDIAPQKGTFVARIRLSDVAEAGFMRRALEMAVVAAITPGMSEEVLRRLERLLVDQATALEAADWEAFYRLDERFHAILAERTAMPRLAGALDVSRAPLARARRLLVPDRDRSRETLNEHRAIHAAFVVRDTAAAERAMGVHLDRALAEIRLFASRKPDLFEA